MEQLAGHAATVFMGFFAVMNPVANTPVFLGLTAEDAESNRRKVAFRAILATFLIIMVFTVAGKLIFTLFGISLPAFRLAGGILLFMIGYHMLQGEQSRMHNPTADDAKKSLQAELSVAISPLAVPILAGPGTIATAVNFASPGGIMNFVVTIAAFFVLCIVTYLFFISGERFVRYIGENGIKVVTRLMGLILTVIGTQMFIEGAKGAFDHITS